MPYLQTGAELLTITLRKHVVYTTVVNFQMNVLYRRKIKNRKKRTSFTIWLCTKIASVKIWKITILPESVTTYLDLLVRYFSSYERSLILKQNEEELKRIKVTFISDQAGKICGGRWRILAWNNFYQDKRMSLQLEIGESAENLRMKSKRWGFGKSWNSGLLDTMKSNFLGL